MVLVTFFLPSGFVPIPAPYLTFTIYVAMVYSPIWVYATDFTHYGVAGYTGFFFFNPAYLIQELILSALNLVFLWSIIRYYQGKTSRNTAISIGVLSLVPPVIMPLVISFGRGLVYLGPLPLQFLIGLLLLLKVKGPEEVFSESHD